MNFLAHLYLSENYPNIMIGNFIADGIHGKKYMDFPKDMQTGILLHRQIDTFTDAHKTFRESTKRLHKNYGHYSGVVVDIFYDHFLAKNWFKYSDTTLDVFVGTFYNTLQDHFEILPNRIQKLMPHMIADNWLVSYASIEGITKVLEGMNRRTKNRSQMNLAVRELQEFYNEFEDEFTRFFDELITFSNQKLIEISA